MTDTRSQHDDDCPLCKAAEPTDLNRLFDAVNLALTGCQLSEYENFGTLTIEAANLDLRKLLALLKSEERYTRPDGREEETPKLPAR